MDKLKKVFSPGHSKDDEVMYGKPTDTATTTDQTSSTNQPHLETDPEAEKKSHGIFRQILNPGGGKHDEVAYGTTATEAGAGQTSSTGGPQLKTDPEAEKNSHSIGRQILNPGGAKYSEQSYGNTATTSTGRTHLTSSAQDDASVLSMKSGIIGPYAGRADSPPLGAAQSSTVPPAGTSTTTRQEPSSEWGDSTLAGIGAADGSHLPESDGIQREDKGDDVHDATYTARSYQLSSGVAGEPHGPDRTVEPLIGDAPPYESSSYVRDGSLAGAGTIIGAGTVSASALAAQENKPHDAEVENATYTARSRHVGGTDPANVDFHDPPDPSKLDTAGRLGPHIPAERQ